MKRLKDKDLQKQLDDLSDGSFSEGLAKAVIKLHDDSGIPLMKVEFGPVVGKSMTRRFILVFEEGDIEDTPEYNPKEWNNYPEVTPPVGVWMRCEWLPSDGKTYRFIKMYLIGEDGEGYWTDCNGDWDYSGDDVDRFRPWEN